MENEVRELLREIAEDLPPHREAPRSLRPRARRRIAASVAMTIVLLCAVTFGGLAAVRSIIRSSARPPVPGHRGEPTPLGPGEVLIGGSDLVAQDPGTRQLRTIVETRSLPRSDGSITRAEWSSDRNWVAFRRGNGSAGGSLWVADRIGGALRRLAPVSGYSRWAWSPTGDHLVLARGRDVTLFDAATGRQTDLGTAIGTNPYWGDVVHALAWSPDGSRIVYDGGPGSGSVYSIDVETGEHSLLVGEPAGAGAISDIDWSPDGAHLAIAYYARRTWTRQSLYLTNADGSRLRLVAEGPEVGMAWSPDGTRLAYTTISGQGPRDAWQAWTVSVDGSAPSLVASQCCVSGGVGVVWSPDGSQIAFETESEAGRTLPPAVRLDHLVVNADGIGDPTRIDELLYRSWAGGAYFCGCYG
jgi:Tol biopolymer transport system component